MFKRNAIDFILILIICMLAQGILTSQSKADTRIVYDYVFVLDTSGSMVGKPEGSGHAVIFPKVKANINKFLENIAIGSNVFIVTFDEGVRSTKHFHIRTEKDIVSAQKYINNLKAVGQNTWIYRSLIKVMDLIYSFKIDQGKKHIQVIYLYTDGLDNDRSGKYTMKDIVETFNLKKGEHDWLYYCTLGVKLPEKDRITLNRAESVTLIEEEKGEIRPLIQIEPKIVYLDFGNLLNKEESEIYEIFKIHNQEMLAPDFELQIDYDFPGLQNIGAFAEIAPKNFHPLDKIVFKLSLVNRQILERHHGVYEGALKFISPVPNVLITPNTIKIRFSYENEKIIQILPAEGNRLPINFGKFCLQKNTEPLVLEKSIAFKFNEEAFRKKSRVKVWLTFSHNNPDNLEYGKNILLEEDRDKEGFVIVSPPNDRIKLKAVLGRELKPGTYSGRLNFQGDNITIKGKNIKHDVTSGLPYYFVNWKFIISKPPIPLWKKILLVVLLLIIVAVVSFIIYSKVTGIGLKSLILYLRPPVIPEGTLLSCIKLDDDSSKSVSYDISGKNEVSIGNNTELLSDSEDSLTIRAAREGQEVYLEVVDVNGDAMIIEYAGNGEERELFPGMKIVDGDRIKIDKYEITLSSPEIIG